MTEDVRQRLDDADPVAASDPRGAAERDAQSDTAPTGQADELQTLRSELEGAREEAASNQDRYLRIRADMENYKRRLQRTYADLARTSKKTFLQKLLNVKDNLERALRYAESADGADDALKEGVRMTHAQLDQLLAQEGVRPIEAEGKSFDPRVEEAVQSVNDPNLPDHSVVQVVRPGYTYGDEENDDVLRPAQVVVNVHGSD
ncbi:MAG TPA: nucleotide exchange factor GrpE, partial [Chloroflexota bacterium]